MLLLFHHHKIDKNRILSALFKYLAHHNSPMLVLAFIVLTSNNQINNKNKILILCLALYCQWQV